MCRVLNILDIKEFCIFLNFRKYQRVLNMRRDANVEKF